MTTTLAVFPGAHSFWLWSTTFENTLPWIMRNLEPQSHAPGGAEDAGIRYPNTPASTPKLPVTSTQTARSAEMTKPLGIGTVVKPNPGGVTSKTNRLWCAHVASVLLVWIATTDEGPGLGLE